jgi:hypothetical protein
MTLIQTYFSKMIYYVQNCILSVIQQILFVTKQELGIGWAVTVTATGKYQLLVIYEWSTTSLLNDVSTSVSSAKRFALEA